MRILTGLFFSAVGFSLALAGCVTSTDIVAEKHHSLGRAEAQQDIARGHLAFEVEGTPTPYLPECVELLRDRYGIEYRHVQGCVVVDSTISMRTKGYNEVMRAEIERRFGPELWSNTEADAKALHARRQHQK